MTDAWHTHVIKQTRRLEKHGNGSFSPDFSDLESFKDKTLIWYDALHDTYQMTDLRDLVWSLEYGCGPNVTDEDAYVNHASLQFLGLGELAHYALRRNTALSIREHIFRKTPGVLKKHFLESPFGTVITHPFVGTDGMVPGMRLMFMMVIDTDIELICDEVKKESINVLSKRFWDIDKLVFFQELRRASVALQIRSEPLNLHSSDMYADDHW